MMNMNTYSRIKRRLVEFADISISKIGERDIYKGDSANRLLFSAIKANKPLLISRFGTTEGDFIRTWRGEKAGEKKVREQLSCLWKLSGVYPASESQGQEFYEVYTSSARDIDICGVRCTSDEFTYWEMEKDLVKDHCSNSKLVDIQLLAPYFHSNPWTLALQDKVVLVIHPFVKTIKSQLSNLDSFFGYKFFPDCKWILLESPQTLGLESMECEFPSWSLSLANLIEKVSILEFDIALIGCGAYGLPIGSFIKRQGKIAVHIGGVLQTFFGIYGQRWTGDLLRQLPNESLRYWVWPSVAETPKTAGQVEGGVYWNPNIIKF